MCPVSTITRVLEVVMMPPHCLWGFRADESHWAYPQHHPCSNLGCKEQQGQVTFPTGGWHQGLAPQRLRTSLLGKVADPCRCQSSAQV